MENKYYTPTIEEFHVGFEYEVNFGSIENPDWVKESLYRGTEVIVLPFMITQNIRVKYLDKEDIESLGWEFVSLKYEGNKIRKLKKEYLNKDITSLKSWEIEYCYYYMDYNFDTNHLVIHNDQEYSASYVWFDGIIKNKSELKILLKQLGIE